MTTVLEAWDLLRFLDQYGEKLDGAAAELATRTERVRENAWMRSGYELLDELKERAAPVLEKMRALPEMTAAREEHATSLIGPFVDLLEKLLAGITFHFGSRAPVIEALYPHTKLSSLRRATLEELRSFYNDFERRQKSSYVERMFAQEDFSFAREVIAKVNAAHAEIVKSSEVPALSEEELAVIAGEALALASEVELRLGQIRFLAEAALLPIDGAFAGAGLAIKMKKRPAAPKVTESDVPAPVVEVVSETPAEAAAEVEDAVVEPDPAEEPVVIPEPKTRAVKKRGKKAAAAEAAEAD